MRKKKQVTINLTPQVVDKAREYGLNISKISENALKDYINRLESSETQTEHNPSLSLSTGSLSAKEKVCGAPAGIRTRVFGSKGLLTVWTIR